MGFSQTDFLELQGLLDRNKIRFGPRHVPRERLNVPYQGLRPDVPQKPKRPAKEGRKTNVEPGYKRYQLRLF
jgi:hypothetical protein